MSRTQTRPAPGTRRAARSTADEGGPEAEKEPRKPASKAEAPSTDGAAKAASAKAAPAKDGAAPARSRAAGRPVPSASTAWKIVAVLGVLGTIGFAIAWRTTQADAVTEDGLSPKVVEMRTAARDFAIALTNFDAATIDADFDRIVDAATGEFAEEADRFYDEQIRSDLRDAQASSQSEVRSLYVQEFAGDRGTVFAVVDQTVVNNLSPRPVTDTLRVELGMARVDGRWKVQTVEVLDAPASAQLGGSGLAEDPAATTTPGG